MTALLIKASAARRRHCWRWPACELGAEGYRPRPAIAARGWSRSPTAAAWSRQRRSRHAPYPLPADGGGRRAHRYQNVKVLGGMSKDRFDHLMARDHRNGSRRPSRAATIATTPPIWRRTRNIPRSRRGGMLEMTRAINSQLVEPRPADRRDLLHLPPRPGRAREYKWAVADDPAGSHDHPRQQARPEFARSQCRLCLAAVRSVRRLFQRRRPDQGRVGQVRFRPRRTRCRSRMPKSPTA